MAAPRRGAAATPARHALVGLVSRLLLAQAAVSGAIGLAYLHASVTGLALILVLAVALGCLAALVRSGGRGAWLTVVGGEGVIAVAGLLQIITSTRYLGGTLLALVTLAVVLHPAVGRAFGLAPRSGRPGRERCASASRAWPRAPAAGPAEKACLRGWQSGLRPSRYDLVARHPIRGGAEPRERSRRHPRGCAQRPC